MYGRRTNDIPAKRLHHGTSRFTKKVMVPSEFHGVEKLGYILLTLTPLTSVLGITLLLNRGVLRYYDNDFIFQQDWADSHISDRIQQWLEDAALAFIKKVNGRHKVRTVIR